MDMINVKIDGISVQVPNGSTVLEAAHAAKVRIPTLCYLRDVNCEGSCRVCVVQVKGARSLQASCVLPATDGMEVITNSPEVRAARKANLQLLLSNHDRNCLACVRNGNCELQTLSEEFKIKEYPFEGERIAFEEDCLSTSLVRDPNKCILCRRCVAACHDVQKIGVLGAKNRGFKTIIGPVFDKSMKDVPCVYCGQCITSCPTGALREKDETPEVWEALADKEKYVVAQTAPAVRAALGEMFGMPMGTSVTGKMVAALRRLGFDKVFDVDWAADLTIMEEGYELIDRIKNGGKLPMITSCSPGWIKFCEHYYPEFIENLSTCKSPNQMMGAMVKTYFAQKAGVDPSKIVVVSIMPCTSKKFEAQRDEMKSSGYADVDISLTTRELGYMIKEAGIDFVNLPDEDFDSIMGESTGAGVIFGATGGVMEAALRTVYEVVTGKPLPDVNLTAVRGLEGIKEATVDLDGLKVNVAVAHGTANARKVLDAVKSGEKDYHFIEIMACPGGCVNGGGQPIVPARERMDKDIRSERAKALYAEDLGKPKRKSHENAEIKQVYDEFLGEPNGHKSHELLHTHYQAKPRY